MCYQTIKGILGSCESLCLLPEFFFWREKNKFLIFFLLGGFFCCGIVVGRFGIVVGRCGSLWVVVGRCGSLWVVVDRCGSLWVVVGRPGFSNYASAPRVTRTTRIVLAIVKHFEEISNNSTSQ